MPIMSTFFMHIIFTQKHKKNPVLASPFSEAHFIFGPIVPCRGSFFAGRDDGWIGTISGCMS